MFVCESFSIHLQARIVCKISYYESFSELCKFSYANLVMDSLCTKFFKFCFCCFFSQQWESQCLAKSQVGVCLLLHVHPHLLIILDLNTLQYLNLRHIRCQMPAVSLDPVLNKDLKNEHVMMLAILLKP